MGGECCHPRPRVSTCFYLLPPPQVYRSLGKSEGPEARPVCLQRGQAAVGALRLGGLVPSDFRPCFLFYGNLPTRQPAPRECSKHLPRTHFEPPREGS